jgi:GNAT superfamily N-acetyltransferase
MFVRLAIAGDEDAVVQMIADEVRETMPEDPVDESVIRARFRQYLETSFPTIFVLEQNRRLIGVAAADTGDFDHRAGFFVIFKLLYVLPEKRGTRAAVLLTNHLVQWADQIGAGEILGGNDNGFRPEQMATFLEHFGFQRVGFTMKRSYGRQINAKGQQ